ncbi:hypothetical protein SEA_GIBBLES_31 [Gordonia phage Gibbles]|uniref:Uncharacterized protein n=3 Tax=Gordonia phage Orchid TaxID=1838075 RepID=A0A166YGB4_9CAUD|nr:hypothetical protein BH761_gp032 [Gordonia phage Orchid]ANA87266.1 hypothetical protein PBI_PATRICKSTAR_32 [Gordonia phage PatrickStar]ANA87493.1 hypothetical protein PBI_KAMPE_32 [Gordonia phage Kampe]AXH46484.1 hypothetical protein SEA_ROBINSPARKLES_35 [Gordonia phage RobinSparkles]QDK01990.1 hypothetical protein SEA_GIBBLES_31 [Gordonia phage Gibbles]ANA87379.1 hypothetical protein PBI_ORCHID_32 [Gordonia phage Orchid]
MKTDALNQLLWAENTAVVQNFTHETLYGIGTIVVALATLVGAFATYKSIKDRSQLRSYDELEKELEDTRKEFRERLNNRDLEHQEERDNIDARWREAFDKNTNEFRQELDTVRATARATAIEVSELKRVSIASINHIDKQNHQLREVGINPAPLPIEVEIFKNKELERGENS